MKEITLWGKDYQEEGARELKEINSSLALAIARGYDSPYSSKTDPNEDALTACCEGPYTLMAVADAHWGQEASHLAISICRNHFQRWLKEEKWRERDFRSLFEEVEIALYEKFVDSYSQSQCSETTLTVAGFNAHTGRLDYGHYGDSYLVLFHSQGGINLLPAQQTWLGIYSYLAGLPQGKNSLEMPRAPLEEALITGHRSLSEGTYILLCTDGLTQPVYGTNVLEVADFQKLSHDSPSVYDLSHRLLKEALRRDRFYRGSSQRGGEDNVAFVLLEI